MTRALRIAFAASAMLVMVLLCVGVAVAAPAPADRASGVQVAYITATPPALQAQIEGQSTSSSPNQIKPKVRPAKPIPKSAQGAYDMSLTLPSYGLSGCMVCHGDPSLVRIKAGKVVSYYMDQDKVDKSAHARLQCTACHSDFSFTAPHKTTADWRASAKDSCKNCHKKEWDAYSKSVHGPGSYPGVKSTGKAKPLCGDCHGGHYIPKASTDPQAAAKLHASAKELCGDCHQAYWANYDDYYHGAAYKRGASDAPACWDCHGAHGILPSSERESATNAENLSETCGKCHKNASGQYLQYAQIIHKKDLILAANPVYAAIRQTGQTISGALSGFVQALQSALSPQAAKATTR